MSSPRDRLLDHAVALFDEGGLAAVTMSGLARAAGLTRQAVYFHFADRTVLLIALVERIDQRQGLDDWRARLEQARDGTTALRLWATMQAERNPKIALLVRAFEADQTTEATNALQTRLDNRMRFARQLVGRLADDGVLCNRWDNELAATLLWTLTSVGVWDSLVNQAGLTPDQYVNLVCTTAVNALSNQPPSQPRKSPTTLKVGRR